MNNKIAMIQSNKWFKTDKKRSSLVHSGKN